MLDETIPTVDKYRIAGRFPPALTGWCRLQTRFRKPSRSLRGEHHPGRLFVCCANFPRMKVRILGFEPDYTQIPSTVPTTAGFQWLVSNSGFELSSVFMAGAVRVEDFFLGVLIKARDARTLTTMRRQGGVFTVKAKPLPEGEKVSETNFFLAHHLTGRGLYAHHHGSASLTMNFGRLCIKNFDQRRRALMEAAVTAAGDVPRKNIVALRKQYAGRFTLSKVLSKGRLKDFLAEMKRVSSFESTFTSFDLEEPLCKPISKLAQRKRVQFQFPSDLNMDLIDDDILEAASSAEISDFKVSAYDQNDQLARFRSAKNALVFEEYDYDEVLGGVNLAFDNWLTSLVNNEVAKRLIALAKTARISRILTAPC